MRASNGTRNLYSYRRLPVSAILKRGEVFIPPVSAILKKGEVFIPSPHLTSTLDRSQMLGALTRPSSIYRQLFEWNPQRFPATLKYFRNIYINAISKISSKLFKFPIKLPIPSFHTSVGICGCFKTFLEFLHFPNVVDFKWFYKFPTPYKLKGRLFWVDYEN